MPAASAASAAVRWNITELLFGGCGRAGRSEFGRGAVGSVPQLHHTLAHENASRLPLGPRPSRPLVAPAGCRAKAAGTAALHRGSYFARPFWSMRTTRSGLFA